MMSRLAISAIFALTIAPAAALAAGDPGSGRRIAAETCAACHQVEGSAPSNRSGASFVAIGRMPSTTELSVKVFLQSSHRNMPNFILSPDEIEDVTAYILGLGSK
jgi:mono/diheme cytochrome c family protein